MNRLKQHTVYLAGPIDESKETAHLWRRDMSEFLWENEIGVLNPCDKPSGMHEGEDFVDYMNNLKDIGDFDKVSNEMSKIVRIDLHMVDLCNFVILYVNKDTHMCGSYGEQTYAALEKKPVIVICEQGKNKIPSWLFGTGMRHEMFFSNFEDAKSYIKHVAYDYEVDCLNRWRFIDYDKVFNTKVNV